MSGQPRKGAVGGVKRKPSGPPAVEDGGAGASSSSSAAPQAKRVKKSAASAAQQQPKEEKKQPQQQKPKKQQQRPPEQQQQPKLGKNAAKKLAKRQRRKPQQQQQAAEEEDEEMMEDDGEEESSGAFADADAYLAQQSGLADAEGGDSDGDDLDEDDQRALAAAFGNAKGGQFSDDDDDDADDGFDDAVEAEVAAEEDGAEDDGADDDGEAGVAEAPEGEEEVGEGEEEGFDGDDGEDEGEADDGDPEADADGDDNADEEEAADAPPKKPSKWRAVELPSSMLMQKNNQIVGLVALEEIDAGDFGQGNQDDNDDEFESRDVTNAKEGAEAGETAAVAASAAEDEADEQAKKEKPAAKKAEEKKPEKSAEKKEKQVKIELTDEQKERERKEREKAKKEKKKEKEREKKKKEAEEKRAKVEAEQWGDDDSTWKNNFPVSEWDAFDLHPRILRAIHELGFKAPTPIQKATLPAAMRYKDVIGAAETGSGKTLSFGLPILHRLLTESDARREKAQKKGAAAEPVKKREASDGVAALILTPTRELALQIVNHIQAAAKYTPIQVMALVGGMAPEKQKRLLSYKPHIVVATPGRLWEMITGGDPHLSDMSALRFLVLDEADRMVANGHFPELDSIITYVQAYKVDDEEGAKGERKSKFQGKTTLVRVDENAKAKGKGKGKQDADGDENMEEEEKKSQPAPSKAASADGKPPQGLNELELMVWEAEQKEKTKRQLAARVRRQVFLFSATLTLADDGRQAPRRKVNKNGKEAQDTHTLLVELKGKLHFNGKPVLVDLSSEHKVAAKIEEKQLHCLLEDKELYLYYFLSRHPGKTLIFVNAISCLRRLLGLLGALNFPAFGLHANMQQRARLKNLDRFKAEPRGVIVCTDVAARGLDIPAVQYVVQYQIPRSAEVYVHRAGRTARAGSEGMTLSLVDPQDEKNYKTIIKALNKPDGIDEFEVDMAYLPPIRNILNLARKIDQATVRITKEKSDKDWFKRAAAEAEIELDDMLKADAGIEDDEVDEEHATESQRNRMRNDQQLASWKAQLKQLLAAPVVQKGVARGYFTLNQNIPIGRDGKVDLDNVKRG